jgi:hypothetical protein
VENSYFCRSTEIVVISEEEEMLKKVKEQEEKDRELGILGIFSEFSYIFQLWHSAKRMKLR